MESQTETLIKSVIDYSRLLSQSKTNVVYNWTIEFLQESSEWCVYIETELSVLSPAECESILKTAQKRTDQFIPSNSTLFNALYYFYFNLLENKYLSNEVYSFVLSHYKFLTKPDKSLLMKDLSLLSTKSVTENILIDLLNDLNSI